MPASIPTLGYPSRTEAVCALRVQGYRPARIGRILGMTQHQVSNLLQSDRRHQVNFPREVLKLLEPHAARRGMSVSGLAIAIVFAAAEDKLIDALLDDK